MLKSRPSVLNISGIRGLSEAEARARIQQEGFNELPVKEGKQWLHMLWEIVREPMLLMLLASGGLYLLMGDFSDAMVLLASVFLVMGITFVQERRTERALDALRDLSSPRALVIRDSEPRRIAGREVARGDWVVLSEGDRVPADVLLRQGLNVSADESVLTGESVPVNKKPSDSQRELEKPGGDGLSSLFSGTVVTQGQGVAEVVAIGSHSELGKIGNALQALKTEAVPLERETQRLVRMSAVFGFSACVVVVLGYALSRGGNWDAWKHGFLAGIALAMSVLPEEIPVVLTVFLALGAWRLSKRQVLARRMPTIETLGETTVLCVDKTGTLTRNQMSLQWLGVKGDELDLSEVASKELPEQFHEVLENATLASKPDPFDPMERALLGAANHWLGKTEHVHPEWNLVREYPLTDQVRAVSHAWATPSGELVVASKGAPEAIADLCHLNPDATKVFLQQAQRLA